MVRLGFGGHIQLLLNVNINLSSSFPKIYETIDNS